MLTKTELVELLRDHGLRLSKRLGQHYLIDRRLVERLLAHCQLSREATIVEIGAGLGALTAVLAPDVRRLIAVEVDRGICELLRRRARDWPNVEVRCEDILQFDWSAASPCVAIGAIPYHITSPIVLALAEHAADVSEAWLAMQKEVAQRLVAKPGTKAYGRLTVAVQYRFDVEIACRISRAAFFPQPAVDSAWVHLRPRTMSPIHVPSEDLFFDVVRAAFSKRRKMLVNCLVEPHARARGTMEKSRGSFHAARRAEPRRATEAPSGQARGLCVGGSLSRIRLNREDALEAIRQAGLPERTRGEELSLEAFAKLTQSLARLKAVR